MPKNNLCIAKHSGQVASMDPPTAHVGRIAFCCAFSPKASSKTALCCARRPPFQSKGTQHAACAAISTKTSIMSPFLMLSNSCRCNQSTALIKDHQRDTAAAACQHLMCATTLLMHLLLLMIQLLPLSCCMSANTDRRSLQGAAHCNWHAHCGPTAVTAAGPCRCHKHESKLADCTDAVRPNRYQ